MRKTFIETRSFTRWVTEHLSDREYAAFQLLLMANPDAGSVMPGCGGLRKIRIADPTRGKGKRGGARIIYLHVAEADSILLVDAYSKEEAAELTTEQKKVLRRLAEQFKQAATAKKKKEQRNDWGQ